VAAPHEPHVGDGALGAANDRQRVRCSRGGRGQGRAGSGCGSQLGGVCKEGTSPPAQPAPSELLSHFTGIPKASTKPLPDPRAHPPIVTCVSQVVEVDPVVGAAKGDGVGVGGAAAAAAQAQAQRTAWGLVS
jgi:hypothetical protein